jgi:predicted transcriptional regulator
MIVMANNNPYPNLDNVLLDLIKPVGATKMTDLIRSVPCPESTIRSHLHKLCKEKKIERVHTLYDMRSSYYRRIEKT